MVLLLRLLEDDVLARLWVVLFKLDLARHELLILARPVHLPGALRLELYELILRHDNTVSSL